MIAEILERMGEASRIHGSFAMCLVAYGASGCVGVGNDTTRGVMNEWARLENGKPHKDGREDEDIRRATVNLARGIVQGAIDAWMVSQKQTATRDATDKLIKSASEAASQAITDRLTPVLAGAFAEMAKGAVQGASVGVGADLGPALNRAAAQLTQGLMRGMASGMKDSLLPVLGSGLSQLNSKLGPALNSAGAQLAEGVMVGLAVGLKKDVADLLKGAIEAPLNRLDATLDRIEKTLILARGDTTGLGEVVVGLIALGVIVILVVVFVRRTSQREAAVRHLARSIRSAHDQNLSIGDLVQQIQRNSVGESAGRYLTEFFRRHPELKV